jgi:surfeit locus 1 family protein
VVVFVALGLWQLDRLDQRRTANGLIEERTAAPVVLEGAPVTDDNGASLDYQLVDGTIRYLDGDVARIVNRSQGGAAGEHVVALAELPDGSLLPVNRGFIPINVDAAPDPVPGGFVEVRGWLRATVERGLIGATDDGTGDRLPRFDTERLSFRLGRDLPPVWLQVAPPDGGAPGLVTWPEPVPLPPLDEGPHLGYALQWFMLSVLGSAFYGALLYRRSGGHRSTVTVGAS